MKKNKSLLGKTHSEQFKLSSVVYFGDGTVTKRDYLNTINDITKLPNGGYTCVYSAELSKSDIGIAEQILHIIYEAAFPIKLEIGINNEIVKILNFATIKRRCINAISLLCLGENGNLFHTPILTHFVNNIILVNEHRFISYLSHNPFLKTYFSKQTRIAKQMIFSNLFGIKSVKNKDLYDCNECHEDDGRSEEDFYTLVPDLSNGIRGGEGSLSHTLSEDGYLQKLHAVASIDMADSDLVYKEIDIEKV